MPTDTRPAPPFPPYTPLSRRRDRARAWISRTTPHDVLLAILAILAGLGVSILTPGMRLTKLELRAERVDRRIDTLAEQQRFTNYMLCVNARRTDPASAPPDCSPIIESRRPR